MGRGALCAVEWPKPLGSNEFTFYCSRCGRSPELGSGIEAHQPPRAGKPLAAPPGAAPPHSPTVGAETLSECPQERGRTASGLAGRVVRWACSSSNPPVAPVGAQEHGPGALKSAALGATSHLERLQHDA